MYYVEQYIWNIVIEFTLGKHIEEIWLESVHLALV